MPSQPKSTTQTTKVQLTPEQKELIGSGMDLTKQVTGNPDGLPNIPGPVDFNANESASMAGILAKAGQGGSLSNLTNQLGDANNFLLGDVMDVNNNQGLQGAIKNAIQPLEDQFTRVIKPGMAHQGIGTGEFSSFGGTKSVLGEDLANRSYLDAVGNKTNDIIDRTYTANLDAFTRGVGMAPQTQRALLYPEVATGAVGDQQRQLAQGQAQAQFENSMFPFNLGLQLLGASGAMPGAGTSATVKGAAPGGNPFLQLLGGVAGTMAFGPIGGSVGSSIGGMI